ncbi:hypothetical protein AGMMS50268_08610 [Spirochaetia bacterium]|nr:hypothetical protein AGMMS50268_08610 [Spirochaetia bacterium]
MKNYQKFLMGMFGMALVFGMIFTGCGDGAGGNNNPPPRTPQNITYESSAGGNTYRLVITENTSRAAYTALAGDTYELTITTGGTNKISRGTVQTAGGTLTLKPSNGEAFTVTITGGNIRDITGQITLVGGEKEDIALTFGKRITITGLAAYNGKAVWVGIGPEAIMDGKSFIASNYIYTSELVITTPLIITNGEIQEWPLYTFGSGPSLWDGGSGSYYVEFATLLSDNAGLDEIFVSRNPVAFTSAITSIAFTDANFGISGGGTGDEASLSGTWSNTYSQAFSFNGSNNTFTVIRDSGITVSSGTYTYVAHYLTLEITGGEVFPAQSGTKRGVAIISGTGSGATLRTAYFSNRDGSNSGVLMGTFIKQ